MRRYIFIAAMTRTIRDMTRSRHLIRHNIAMRSASAYIYIDNNWWCYKPNQINFTWLIMMTVHHEPRSLTSHPRLLDITQYILILASQVKTYLPVDRELISGRHFHNIGINSPDLMNVIIMASEIPRAINYIKLRQNGDSSWQSPLNRSMYQGMIESWSSG